jgi:tripartite-type tricarboxylate transporter receptor subunit TctC
MKKIFMAILAYLMATLTFAQGDSSVIRIIIGFPPGGNTDVVARALSTDASKTLGKSIIIESRSGASGAIAAGSVAQARPDGSTLLLVTSANAMLPALNKNLKYKALDDFEWVATFATYPLVVVVNKNSKIHSFKELVEKSREAPGSISYSSPGEGTAPHLTTELLSRTVGAQFQHVPYRGEMPAMVDLIGSHVDFSILTAPTVLPRIQSGELRALAVTSAGHWKALPDIPSVAQLGYPKFDITSWVGLAAPKGTPAVEVARLNNAFLQAQNKPEMKKFLEDKGMDNFTLTPNETRLLMQREIRDWGQRVKTANIKPE